MLSNNHKERESIPLCFSTSKELNKSWSAFIYAVLFTNIENVFWVGCMSEQQGYKGLPENRHWQGKKQPDLTGLSDFLTRLLIFLIGVFDFLTGLFDFLSLLFYGLPVTEENYNRR